MALNGQPPRPKEVKIHDEFLKKSYKKDNPYCEVCWLGGLIRDSGIETHHIIPGHGRTDELWNIIRICREHHMECTYHVAGYDKAYQGNLVCLAIKWLKNEITRQKIIELGRHELVGKAVEYLLP